ncbi:MAG: septal ring lytic transglycosylase RlpA family protein [Ignavibacteriales bacterium]|nr:septal ring lytic transglycosylase RlpA family protein [Ignavibacteriales bacterium]
MKIATLYRLFLLSVIGLFVGCSLSTRYSKSINENEKSEIKGFRILETETGTASYYADEFNGSKTANGEIYYMNALTAAHPTYPFNTELRVTNLQNGKSVEVRVNDRMPQFKTEF